MRTYKALTFVGGGWTDVQQGNDLGIKNSLFADSNYWVHNGTDRITCQKNFKARIFCVQGVKNTNYVRGRRSIYTLADNVTTDFLDTTFGGEIFATVIKEFKTGDVVRCWEENSTSGGSIGLVFILEV